MLVSLDSFYVPVFIFSCIIHSGGYDPIWCLVEPPILNNVFTEIPDINPQVFLVILRFHKKFPVILRNS